MFHTAITSYFKDPKREAKQKKKRLTKADRQQEEHRKSQEARMLATERAEERHKLSVEKQKIHKGDRKSKMIDDLEKSDQRQAELDAIAQRREEKLAQREESEA